MEVEKKQLKRHHCSFEGCTKSFGRPYRLEIHIRTHTNERPFVCSYDGCDKSYTRQQHLSRHYETSHCSVDEKKSSTVKCEACGADFATATILDVHMKIHEKQFELEPSKLYKCPEENCEDVFHKKKQLVVHRMQHVGNLSTALKCHKCPHEGCEKTFVFPNKLRRHLKTHQGYRCDADDCSEVLLTWSALRKHKAENHAPESKCHECGLTFKQKTNLRQHMKIHEGTRNPVTCEIDGCRRTFLYAKNLTAHVKEMHKGEAIWKGKKKKSAVTKKEKKVQKKRSAAACWLYLDDRGQELKPHPRAPGRTKKNFKEENKTSEKRVISKAALKSSTSIDDLQGCSFVEVKPDSVAADIEYEQIDVIVSPHVAPDITDQHNDVIVLPCEKIEEEEVSPCDGQEQCSSTTKQNIGVFDVFINKFC